jgi:hypothetical protein
MASDYEVKQAIGIVARLGGYAIKRVATTDDLKDRSLTITLTRVSDGWVQESMAFEDIPPLVATVDGNGHVLASHPRPKTFGFGSGDGEVTWGRPSQSNCFVLGTINDVDPGFVSTTLVGLSVEVHTYDPGGKPAPHTVDLTILCGPT